LPDLFLDRADAGRLLAAEVASRLRGANAVVLALPRGGVPVAAEVAAVLPAPLDVLVVRKLGVPWRPELAMGAISSAASFLDRSLIREWGISQEQVDEVVARERKELERRERLYRGQMPAPDLKGRTVVLVDDGLATGASMMAAVRHVRAAKPERIIPAVPVGSPDACRQIRDLAGDCICLAEPESFSAVGEWYEDFRQVTDEEVREILQKRHQPA
jgi:predicted phosphoribosyltransferase